MKRCELCKSFARIYCESDQASLCWSCDAKVHSANFLVAKHSRCLLCHSCQSPTRWSASGEKLAPATVSICDRCVVDDDGTGTDGDDDYDGDEDETDLDDKEIRDVNQMVPRSSTPPPPASSSSGSDEYFRTEDRGVSIKRQRQNVADLSFEVDLNCSLEQIKHRRLSSTVSEPAIGGDEAGQILSDTVVQKSKATRADRFDLNSSPWL